jgi:putative membrane protein
MMQYLAWFMKGVAMGAANVIPGVSGGTIAFITGIYERFINALKHIDLTAVKFLLSFRIKELLARVDAVFLVFILGGVGVSILSLAKVLEWTFVHYETLTLSFFFGLIIASVIGVGRQVSQWTIPVIVSLCIGILIAVFIAFLPPAESSTTTWYIVLCGVVAVCSMILPGLSGSYILLLMGNYLLVLQAISSLDLTILIPLGIGCVVGLIAFSRLLSYLFAHFKDITISLLTGFVVGSLLIIWPWKETHYQQITTDKEKAVGYEWQLPALDNSLLLAMLLMLVGFMLVYGMEKAAAGKNP